MKKLTAGIFATLLTMVSVDGAYAAIASKGYVDDQVGAVESTVSTINETVTNLGDTINNAETGLGKQVEDLQTEVAGKQDALGFTPEDSANKTTTLSGTSTDKQYPSAKAVWDTIQTETTGIANEADVTALKGRVDTLETASANHVVKNEAITGGTHTKITYDAKGLVTAGANLTADDIPEIPNTKVSGLGSLATKSSVATDDIASKAVTKAKLADDIVTSLGKADSALQAADLADYVTKEAADAAYADIATEGVADTASENAQQALTNIGTLSNLTTGAKTNTVAAINEVASEAAAAASAASAADGKAVAAQGAAETAQADVDALEGVVNNAETGLAAAHTAIDAVEGRVTTAEGEIDTIQGKISNMATSDAVSSLTTRVTTAEGDIDDLEAAVNDAESGLAATNTIADSALSTAQSAQTTANAALPKATYNSEVGTVSASNMGTTASTVVTAIKEVAEEASTAQSTAAAAQQTATQAQQTANAAIPAPDGECTNGTAKCVLTFNNSVYAWEVIARDGEGE